jgi:hypothetical protein
MAYIVAAAAALTAALTYRTLKMPAATTTIAG